VGAVVGGLLTLLIDANVDTAQSADKTSLVSFQPAQHS
jgi:hypothetical protein